MNETKSAGTKPHATFAPRSASGNEYLDEQAAAQMMEHPVPPEWAIVRHDGDASDNSEENLTPEEMELERRLADCRERVTARMEGRRAKLRPSAALGYIVNAWQDYRTLESLADEVVSSAVATVLFDALEIAQDAVTCAIEDGLSSLPEDCTADSGAPVSTPEGVIAWLAHVHEGWREARIDDSPSLDCAASRMDDAVSVAESFAA
jgi:hypothetical protein